MQAELILVHAAGQGRCATALPSAKCGAAAAKAESKRSTAGGQTRYKAQTASAGRDQAKDEEDVFGGVWYRSVRAAEM